MCVIEREYLVNEQYILMLLIDLLPVSSNIPVLLDCFRPD